MFVCSHFLLFLESSVKFDQPPKGLHKNVPTRSYSGSHCTALILLVSDYRSAHCLFKVRKDVEPSMNQ